MARLVHLTIMSNDDTDIDSMITTFNTAVTDTASEIFGKHRQKKKPWVSPELVALSDKRRELKKEKKKAKENWIGEQCSEIEE